MTPSFYQFQGHKTCPGGVLWVKIVFLDTQEAALDSWTGFWCLGVILTDSGASLFFCHKSFFFCSFDYKKKIIGNLNNFFWGIGKITNPMSKNHIYAILAWF